MPPVEVYSVDFSQGNLVPTVDTNGWGEMKQGSSGPGDFPESHGDSKGLHLSVYRAPGATSPAENGVYVVLGDNVLDMATRLLTHVEFDRPNAHLEYVAQPSNVVPPTPAPAPGSQTPEPWAVALSISTEDGNDVASGDFVAVTTQFVRKSGGVRLNTPFNEQGDKARFLVTPLDYAAVHQSLFQMEHSFCGIGAAGGRTIGNGSLTIGPPFKRTDQRVYSAVGLSTAQQAWIGALGVTLVTISGFGQIMVRLRRFSVSIWS